MEASWTNRQCDYEVPGRPELTVSCWRLYDSQRWGWSVYDSSTGAFRKGTRSNEDKAKAAGERALAEMKGANDA